uniref:WAP domain-containing protein n=1 Tax=Cyprinus carpio TaxID=7962 RepID=A0A8C2BZI9_CYPCA
MPSAALSHVSSTVAYSLRGASSKNEKPGECPSQTSGTLCTTSCNSDSNCPDNEKCCSNGCGSYCTAPYTGIGHCFG